MGNLAYGSRSERMAQKYLISCGLTPVTRNYRNVFGEIDLIMRDGDCLVFIEVKARRGARSGDPLAAITADKLRHIIRVAQAYLAEHPHPGPWRLDAVSVGDRVRHVPNLTV